MSATSVPYGSAPPVNESLLTRGYGGNNNAESLHDSTTNNHIKNAEHLAAAGLGRSPSTAPAPASAATPTRSSTLKKKGSVRRTTSLRRSSSRRSLKAGSIKGLGGADFDSGDFNSAFYTPVPTQGSPTDALADRFQAWRQLLKSLITYFREIQASYEVRAKAIHKVQNTLSNIATPPVFNSSSGLAQASRILEDFHKRSLAEAAKSRDIEEDVIGALSGLRADLGQKIKEIKSLSGDFKNTVEKEKESTRREVEKLQEALSLAAIEDPSATGKHDPFVVRLGVDRAVERQLDEENYLHRAYLNLESSGRELESIVVGEIQKAYNAFAGILKREGDDAYSAVESLRTGPISMPKDLEWMNFVGIDEHFVDPGIPLRRIEDIQYPGKNHPAAAEVRAGMLERKSKYLKSYTPGWYVLSATHLHEFKSADKIYTQPPVMSLYLPDQRLGSKSEPGSSSHKFMLKGKQSGGVHKGHNWVFRAESHDTMLAWFEAIRVLTEETSEKRTAFVRQHARSVSGEQDRRTISSDGFDEDEADATPFTADVSSLADHSYTPDRPIRPQPGGRFPSDLRIPTTNTFATASDDSPRSDVAVSAAPLAGAAPAEASADPYRLDGIASHTRSTSDVYTSPPHQSYDDYYSSTGHAEAPPASSASYPFQQVETQQFYTQQYPAHFNQADPSTFSDLQRPAFSSSQVEPQAPQPVSQGWTHPVLAEGVGIAAGAAGGAAIGTEAVRHHEEPVTPTADVAASSTAPHESISTNNAEPLPSTSAHTSAVVPAPSLPAESQHGLMPSAAVSQSDVLTTASGMTSNTEISQEPVMTPSEVNNEPILGGLESKGARFTGQVIPVIRHDTEMSISGLHIPGEFPGHRGSTSA